MTQTGKVEVERIATALRALLGESALQTDMSAREAAFFLAGFFGIETEKLVGA